MARATRLRTKGDDIEDNAFYFAKDLKKYGPQMRKLHPGFDKLTTKQKRTIVNKKWLADNVPEEYGPKGSKDQYTDKRIRNEILSYLGVASGKYDDYDTTGKDSAGRAKDLIDQKEQNPAGFAVGGMVHRGRKAMRGAD
tara:strand:- start:1455 stop:1871 length:417 start_codon:yes stop_codon:yes gene_type:complete